MALIKSISGIRGTIGGKPGNNLTPQDIVECTAAFGYWLIQQGENPKVIVGRDARISGMMVNQLVTSTLLSLGIDVLDIGLSTTPTVEMAVVKENAGAGIIITASHNPKHWNALKFLNHKGEFISKKDGDSLLKLLDDNKIEYAEVDNLGTYSTSEGYIQQHIDQIIALPLVDKENIQSKCYKVVVDCINSTGAISVIPLLEQLNCEVITLNDSNDGQFAHNPEPLPQNLQDLCQAVVDQGADLGIAVDPDVDRLALVCGDGEFFGEEYTLVVVADYILQQTQGNTVSNLSSSRALRDITRQRGGEYFASAVGEVNVVSKMKAVNAVIGGEGNGGVILPDLHYGRDALAGIALVLSYLAKENKSLEELKGSYPEYHMVKDKISLTPDIDLKGILSQLEEKFKEEDYNTIDGLKVDFEHGWVHLRKSNTEPIIRIYSEARTLEQAKELVEMVRAEVEGLVV